jgi:septal ring factor EnvC (AmiA/AmiB activator)
MVLVKHGNDRISLLAGLGSIAVTLNQSIGSGEPLGSMGSGQEPLYYELREGGKPIDPSNWFANLGPTFANQ